MFTELIEPVAREIARVVSPMSLGSMSELFERSFGVIVGAVTLQPSVMAAALSGAGPSCSECGEFGGPYGTGHCTEGFGSGACAQNGSCSSDYQTVMCESASGFCYNHINNCWHTISHQQCCDCLCYPWGGGFSEYCWCDGYDP
jgi:hypothetical protein